MIMNPNFASFIKDGYFGFDVYLCSHCNLKCRSCTRFSSISKAHFYDFNQYKKDILHLKKIKFNLKFLSFSGGEPLLHPKIINFIEYTRFLFPDIDLSIITNGLAFNKQSETFYKVLRDNNVYVTYTEYPYEKIDYNELINICNYYNIKYRNIFIVDKRTKDCKNQTRLLFSTNRLSENETCIKEIKKYVICNNDCPCLWNGRLYQCGTIPFSFALNEKYNTNFKISDDDYMIITEIKNTEQVFKFWLNPTSFCKYCYNCDNPYQNWDHHVACKSDWIYE